MTSPVLVRLDRVSMAYGRREAAIHAVQDVSLEIRKGEFIAVVGPSGCGKSSLLRLISGLHPPLSGNLSVEGKPVKGPIKSVGMVFQNSNLLPWRKVVDNVLLPLEIVEPHRSRIRREGRSYRERSIKLLESVGLGGFTDKFPWQLSGGMQQRASICRALIHEPEILLLDEPFGALDAFTREDLWCLLRDLHAARAVTVMLVTHDLREAVFLADTVYVMSNRPGRMVKCLDVGISRPRDLEVTYGAQFQTIVHELRGLIGRTGDPAEGAH